jgi:hypothetical protein
VLADGGVRVADAVEDVGGFVGVAEAAEQVKGLLVVIDGLLVLSSVVLDVAEAVEHGRLAVGVIVALERGQGGLAVGASEFVLAQPGGGPAHHAERPGFPHWLAEIPEQIQGAGGVVQG